MIVEIDFNQIRSHFQNGLALARTRVSDNCLASRQANNSWLVPGCRVERGLQHLNGKHSNGDRSVGRANVGQLDGLHLEFVQKMFGRSVVKTTVELNRWSVCVLAEHEETSVCPDGLTFLVTFR